MRQRKSLRASSFCLALLLSGLGSIVGWTPLVAQTTWDGSTDTDWFDASNWSAGVPNRDDDVTIPNGLGNYPVLDASGAECQDLIVESSASISLGSFTIDVYDDVDPGAATVISANSDGEIHFTGPKFLGGALIRNDLTFSGDIRCSKTVWILEFDDVTVSCNNLIIESQTVDCTAGSARTITIAGDVTIDSGATLDRRNATLDIGGSVTINGTLDNSDATGTTTVGGDWTDAGTHTIGTHTVTFDGGGTSTVSVPDSSDFYNLTISNNTTVNVTSAIDINGTVTIGSGSTFDVDADLDVTGGAVTCSGTGRLQLGSSVTSLGTFTAGSGTVEYDDTATNRTIQNVTYQNLEIDAGARTVTTAASETLGGGLTVTSGTFAIGANTVTVTGATDIKGTLTVSSGTLDANGSFDATGGGVTFTGTGRLQLGGAVTSLGTFTESTSTVEYDNTAAGQTVDADTYYNLEIDTSTRVALTAGNVTVTNNLTVTSGTLEVDDLDRLRVDNDVSVSGTLDLEPGSTLELAAATTLTVNSGGTFEAIGTWDELALITSSDEVTPGRYTFSVDAGGIMNAQWAYFRFMDSDGIQITDNGAVTALTAFDFIILDNGASAGRLLKITNNDNTVNFDAVQFFDTNANLGYSVETVSATASITFDRYDNDSNSTGFGGPDKENDNGGGTVTPGFIRWGATTPVRLARFTADPDPQGVLLAWETAAEWQLAGFALERSGGPSRSGGPVGFQPIGPSMIPSQATAPSGARYRCLNDTARAGVPYSYRLIEIGRTGGTGVVATATVAAPSRGTSVVPATTSPTGLPTAASAALLSRQTSGSGHVRLAPTPSRGAAAASARSAALSSTALSSTAAAGPPPIPDLVKIWVEERGITRVSSNLLENAGFDATSDPALWRLTRDGVEVPIRTFQDGMVAGISHYGFDFLAEPIEHLEVRGDVYWLERVLPGGPLPLRLPVESGGAPLATPRTGSSFTTVRREENAIYVSSLAEGEGRDHWFWSALVAPGTVEIPINLDSLVANTPGATLDLSLEAWSQDPLSLLDHTLVVRVNGVDLATIEKNGSGPIEESIPIPPGGLVEGRNEIEIEAIDLGVPSILFLDAVELRFRREHRAREGRIEFSLGAQGVHRIEGFDAAEVVLYRTSGGQGPARIAVTPSVSSAPAPAPLSPALPLSRAAPMSPAATAVGPHYDLIFETGPVTGGSTGALPRFEAFTATGARAPLAVEPVRAIAVPVPTRSVDQIVIAPRRFFAALDPLTNLRRSQGWSVERVDLEAITNEFGAGRTTSDAIRAFLEEAWRTWPSPAPRAVLLVGDATYDPRGNLGISPFHLVPTRLIETRDIQAPSDAYFGDLVGNDGIAELAVGRLPVSTAAECQAVVEKIIEHETVGWNLPGTSIFVSDDDTDFVGLNAEIATRLPLGGATAVVEIGTLPIADLRTLLQLEWQGGAEIVHYTGHGSRQFWADELILGAVDAPLLSAPRLPLVSAMNCLNGYFVHPSTPSLGEALVLEPNAGAIAYWGPTAITSHLGQHQLALAFYEALSAAPGTTIGAAILTAQQALAADPRFREGNGREVLETWVLLGDPLLRVR